jgi:NACHT domain
LRDPSVKNGNSIQEVVADVMRSSGSESGQILPQLFSTLQFLVDFQDLENTFIPLSVQRVPVDHHGAPAQFLTYNDFKRSLLEVDFEPIDVSSFSDYDGNEELAGPRPKVPRLRSRKFENKVSLLSGSPGVGKTLLTQQMAKWVRANFPEYLEFYIHFLQKSDYFSETEWDQVNAMDFLKTEKPGLTDEALKEKIAKQQVVIFLDAFEKICPHYVEPAKIVLRELLELNVPLWVTTRPEEQHTVTEALRCPRLHLLQINNLEKKDQLQLLKVKLKSSLEKRTELVEFFESTGAADFIKNPYHLSLVAEFYKKNNFRTCNLFSCFEHIIDFKIEDVLVVKEGADVNNKQFCGKFRQLKGLLIKMIVSYLSGKTFSEHSEDEISRFNSVGIATINAEKQMKMVHEHFASCLATLEFLNRVRKAKVMGDEGPVLIAPTKYLIDPKFKDVRLFIDSFLSNKEDAATLEKFKSPKFITLSNLHEPDVAQRSLEIIKTEGLENLYEFILEIAEDPDADNTIKNSIWMQRVPIK